MENIINEIWKDIEEYEGIYQISNMGQIYSLPQKHYKNQHTNKGYMKSIRKFKRGYYMITLCKDGKKKSFLLHRLIAKAFIPNPQNLPQINHKDGNKTNNSLDNLEWCTCSHNIKHAIETRLNPAEKPVNQYSKNGEFIKFWKSAAEAAATLKINYRHISNCCNGKPHRKTAYGYKWSFAKS